MGMFYFNNWNVLLNMGMFYFNMGIFYFNLGMFCFNIEMFLSDPGTPGPIYVSSSLKLRDIVET